MDGIATFIVIAVVCAVALGVWRARSESSRAPDGYYCMSCGSQTGDPKQVSPLGAVAILLWLIAIVAALTVSWLCILIGVFGHILANRAYRVVCPTCNHDHLVPAHTPAAKAHAASLKRTGEP